MFFKKKKFEPYLDCNNKSVTCYRSATFSESLDWSNLEAVIIETNDEGPFQCDFFWILVGDNGKGVVVPQGIKGDKELLSRLQELSGFDNKAIIDASCCIENKKFLCWKRKNK